MMKKTFYTTILFACLGIFIGFGQANHGKKHRAKIKKLKIAYFTENLGLTEAEAEKFWPIYNKYDEVNHELRSQEYSKIKKEVGDLDSLSESKADEILDRLENLEAAKHKNKTQLIRKLRKVLPSKKIIRLKKVERDFNRKLMKEYRNRRRRQ